jgi:hypothetical protein
MRQGRRMRQTRHFFLPFNAEQGQSNASEALNQLGRSKKHHEKAQSRKETEGVAFCISSRLGAFARGFYFFHTFSARERLPI